MNRLYQSVKSLGKAERDFVLMYDDYIRELAQYTPLLKNHDINKTFQMYSEYRCEAFTRINVICDGTGVVNGFMVLGIAPNTHPDTNYFIAEFFIKKEYRRKNIGSKYVLDFIKTHPGKYCMFILDKNEVAKCFWFETFNRAGYKPIKLKDVGCCPPYATQYGFAPKEGSD